MSSEFTEYGVLSGFVLLPTGEERRVCMHGTVKELLKVIDRIGLFADPQQVEQLEKGEQIFVLYFTDNKGSHLTMQPVTQACTFLQRTSR